MEKSARNPFYALIAAAGSGTRAGAEIPKQYIEIAGKSVLRHTLEAFLACPGLKEIRVIIDPAHADLYHRAVSGLTLPAPVTGGRDRTESVTNGLKSLGHLNDNDIVLIYDAARPFIRSEDIENVAASMPAASLAVPVADTLRRDDGTSVDRDGLWAMQTPQGFEYKLISAAHAGPSKTFTDDASLVTSMGHEVKIVPGHRGNFKITTADDIDFARRLLENRAPVTRTGFGYDVHAFTAGDKVRLCGVDIPFNKKLEGHSDADVGLHALTDAILGAIAAGDIGQHFPPSDPQWKGADSAIFLKEAVKMIKGYIVNLDLTIICEAPKIGPHREAMQKRIAEICGIRPDQVGIKATTTEGLGFTGRGEGIAAQAVATVQIYNE